MKDYYEKRAVKGFFVFCILAAVVLFPLVPYLFSNSTRKVSPGSANRQACYNLKEVKVKQEIIVQGKVTDFSIYFEKLQQNYGQDEFIEVAVRQGDMEEKARVACAEIRNRQMNEIDLHWPSIQEGMAEVSIASSNLSGDILVYLCSDEKSGLSGAVIDSDKKTAPVCMEYGLFVNSKATFISISMFAVLIVLLAAAAASIVSDWKYAWNTCWILSFFVIVLLICIRQPTASYLGEPRSEAAYEFWKQAAEEGFFGSILNLECGLYYLSFLQRIAAWLAVVITPDVKYVFIIMQMMQTVFIAVCSCMIWSRNLRIPLSKMNRMLVSILFGSCMVVTQSYYFHFMGYWGILFILLFSLLDMEKVKKQVFIAAVLLAAVCCLSKMAYVVVIPCIICYVLYRNKKLTHREVCWMMSMFAGCVIQVAYTFTHTTVFQAGEGLGTIQNPSLTTLINGLFYYGVQGMNTFLFNAVHPNAWYTNRILLCILLVFIGVFVYRFAFHNNENMVMTGLLGVMYFSVLGFTMLTSAGGFDMLASIDWSAARLLNHQHFAFVKIILCLMCVILFTEFFLNEKIRKAAIMIFLVFIAFSNMPVNDENDCGATSKIAAFPTDWKNVSYVTERDSYYVPVNVGYPFALISLTENSYGILIGYDAQGEWKQLPMAVSYPEEIKYHEGVLGDVYDFDTNGILSISTRRSNTYLNAVYEIIVYDRYGDVIQRKLQSNSSDRYWIDFLFDEPLYHAYRVEFVNTTTGREGYVSDSLNIGIDTLSGMNVLDDSEGKEVLKRIEGLDNAISSIAQSQISVEYCNEELILGKDCASIPQAENAVIRGWAVDGNTALPYSEIYAVVDDTVIKGKMGLQRKDVEAAYGNKAVLKSGFTVRIPQELVEDTDEIQLIFADHEYKEVRTIKINHKKNI